MFQVFEVQTEKGEGKSLDLRKIFTIRVWPLPLQQPIHQAVSTPFTSSAHWTFKASNKGRHCLGAEG